MTVRRKGGMLSSGVLLPESIFIGIDDQHVEQPKLWHRARDGAEKDADRRRKEQIDRDAGQEQRDRPGNRNAEQPRTTKSRERPTATMITNAVRPDFRHRDFERRQRHDQQMIHRAVLALADDSRAGQDDRKHRDAVDDPHDTGEPGRRDIWVKGDADVEVDRRARHGLGTREKVVDLRQ